MRFFILAALAVAGPLFADTVSLSAADFSERVKAGDFSDIRKAQLFFVPGRKPGVPASLQRAMVRLAAQGIASEAKLVDENEYNQIVEDLEAEKLHYILTDLEEVSRHGMFDSLKEVLGIPLGVGSFEMSPLKPLQSIGSEERATLYQTLAVHNLVLLTGLTLAQKITAVPLAILSSYFYEVFANFDEILRMKSLGKSVVRNGDTLSVETNPYYVFLTNFVQEVGMNGALGATIPSPGGLSVQSTLETSFVVGLASTSVDKFAAQMETLRLKAIAQGQLELAETIRKRQLFVMKAFFNGVIPLVKTLALLTEGTSLGPLCSTIKGGVFAVAGCHCLYQEMKRVAKLRFLRSRGKGCARALVRLE